MAAHPEIFTDAHAGNTECSLCHAHTQTCTHYTPHMHSYLLTSRDMHTYIHALIPAAIEVRAVLTASICAGGKTYCLDVKQICVTLEIKHVNHGLSHVVDGHLQAVIDLSTCLAAKVPHILEEKKCELW